MYVKIVYIILHKGSKVVNGIHGMLSLPCLCVVFRLLCLFVIFVFFFGHNNDKNVKVVFGHLVIFFCFYSLTFRIENFHKISGQILSDFDFPKLYQQKQKYHLCVFENILIHGFNYLRFKRQLQIILSINDYHCIVVFF